MHSTDPQTATVTLNGLVATVKGVKQGSVSIVGMTSDGDFVAVAGNNRPTHQAQWPTFPTASAASLPAGTPGQAA